MPDIEPAVTDEFADALGLSALKAAGTRSAASPPRSHGNASTPAASPPAASLWPPPPTPDLFKQMVRHLDHLTCELTQLSTGVMMPREEDKYMDEVADQIWPLAHVYGAGAEKPTKGVLMMYAVAALLSFVTLKYSRFKTVKQGGPVTPTLVQ